ncbi:MAG: AAA family ATPase [Candidatus Wallbacteria bacterium]|nr:AAA family ATPase [Candidatus Wallbacteria bacterium]
MAIFSLNIEGFRSLRELCWKPGSLNVVIGPNGSGKSSLLCGLASLRHAAAGGIADALMRQGGMQAVLWDGQAERVSWTLVSDPLHRPVDSIRPHSRYRLTLKPVGRGSAFYVDEESLQEVADAPPATPRPYLERSRTAATFYDALEHPFPVDGSAYRQDEALLSEARGPAALMGPAGNAGPLQFRARLESWAIHEEFAVGRDAEIRRPAVARLEERLALDGRNLIPVLHTRYTGDRDFKQALDEAMSAAFGPDYQELVFPPAADQRVQMRLRWRSLSTEQPAANLSDGTLRFLLLLTLLVKPPARDLLAVDEPETGLHPRMMAVLAEHATDAARETQLVFTTHSRDLLDAFTSQAPTTAVCEIEQGQTRLRAVDPAALREFLQRYTLGDLYRSGDLEALS